MLIIVSSNIRNKYEGIIIAIILVLALLYLKTANDLKISDINCENWKTLYKLSE